MIPQILLFALVATALSADGKNTTTPKLNPTFSSSARYKGYVASFNNIAQNLADDTEAQTAIKELARRFLFKFSDKVTELSSKSSGNISADQLTASAFASLGSTELETEASGSNDGTNTGGKIVISGAKGKVQYTGTQKNAILTMAVSETLETTAVAAVIAYATLRTDGSFNVDVKINDYYQQARQNANGEFIDSLLLSKKFTFNQNQTVFGVSRIYLLTVGENYLRITVYTLLSGAAIKQQTVLSKAIVRIKTYTVNVGGPCTINDGVFLSENICGFVGTCASTYYGWLKVSTGVQEATSVALANLNSGQSGTSANLRTSTVTNA